MARSLTLPRPPALPFLESPWRLPRRHAESHKGDFGRILLVGGSRGMAGSIVLSALSALRSGAGLVTVAVPDRCLESAAGFNPCLMTHALADDGAGRFDESAADEVIDLVDKSDVVAVGPGMRTGSGSVALVRRLFDLNKPRVMDADALNVLATFDAPARMLGGPCVLTPHPGEWHRISGVSAKDRPGQQSAARAFAEASRSVVLLKGAATYVTDGQREYSNRTGNPGMATAGSGDCLTGVIAALMGAGLDPWKAAVLGAWVHGVAGDLAAQKLGMAGLIATDIADHLPWAMELATEPAAGPMPGSQSAT